MSLFGQVMTTQWIVDSEPCHKGMKSLIDCGFADASRFADTSGSVVMRKVVVQIRNVIEILLYATYMFCGMRSVISEVLAAM